MKSWSVTVKTVWYLKSAGQTVKTVRSNGQNRQISRDWAILVLLVSSTLKRDKQKYARSFKKKRDERDLTVRRSNDDRPPVPAQEAKFHSGNRIYIQERKNSKEKLSFFGELKL